jgi:Ca2+-binding EF-hand superfamily protein
MYVLMWCLRVMIRLVFCSLVVALQLNDSMSEFQVAFRLFDTDNDQLISKAEFVNVMNASAMLSSTFDFDCEWLNLFFGMDGR